MKNHRYHDLTGERKEQLLVVCDKNGKPIGTATREECHKGEGIPHLAFMAFVFDKNGKVILTKRGRKKSLWAGFWDASVVSHVLVGETVEQAALRRGKEELGIEMEFQSIGAFHYVAQYKDGVENEYCYILAGQTNKEVHINQVEIGDVKMLSFEELKSKVTRNSNEFTPWLKLALAKFPLME